MRSTSADEDLVAACLKGDAAAWDALIDRYAALIYSIPLRYGLAEADAADVFQAVCMTLLDKLGTVREPRGLAAWLITTTSRQSLAVVRQRQRERARSEQDSAASGAADVADSELLPEEEVLALERALVVRSAIAELSPGCRRLIEALFSDTSEPQSYHHLAEQLGISINSLGPTRARCLTQLRDHLVAQGFSP
ncbi:MAG TPA: sigma-70 family RNA polymerase sigma factor [Chloroflexota bacterium]|nr:sigma-70 family RNA polymerase sigma factor [Chloroflexota bacterium]